MTKLLYLEDSYLFEAPGRVMEVSRDGRGTFCVLQQTVYYPQGGGQPDDRGKLIVADNNLTIAGAEQTRDLVRHYLQDGDNTCLAEGDEVVVAIDSATRLRHARLHTAGHLLAAALEELEPSLTAVKGFHFPSGPYVEFIGELTFSPEELLPRLNERLEKLVAADLAVYHRMIGHDDLRRLCPDLTYPVPKDKPLRVITVKDHRPIPCGGTHVSSTGSLGSSAVRKIRSRSGRIRFSYVVGVAVS